MLPSASLWSIEPYTRSPEGDTRSFSHGYSNSDCSTEIESEKMGRKAKKRAQKGIAARPTEPEKKEFQEIMDCIVAYLHSPEACLGVLDSSSSRGGQKNADSGTSLEEFMKYDVNPFPLPLPSSGQTLNSGPKKSLGELYASRLGGTKLPKEQERRPTMLSKLLEWLRTLDGSIAYWLDPRNCGRISAEIMRKESSVEGQRESDFPSQVHFASSSSWAVDPHRSKRGEHEDDSAVGASIAKEDRKLHQIVNMVLSAMAIVRDGDKIVDFCGGSGHLSVLLAYLLPSCDVLLVDYNRRSLDIALERASSLQLTNLNISHSSIEEFSEDFDLGIGLHACGAATDVILHKCMERRAAVLVAPCCVGKLKHSRCFQYPQSQVLRKAVSPAQFFTVTKAGDVAAFTDLDNKETRSRRLCKTAVEVDRRLFLAEHGYRWQYLLLMSPMEASAKNDILLASTYGPANWDKAKWLLTKRTG
eukprot:gb/GECG01016278.1/.p1 GENE.gb/GECG01016278.1/~~gb/GECG01016278.1/.p1  ORF type:complete len:473 (+),score=51.87 gb/GECG01016278.1/:1-1419(+)